MTLSRSSFDYASKVARRRDRTTIARRNGYSPSYAALADPAFNSPELSDVFVDVKSSRSRRLRYPQHRNNDRRARYFNIRHGFRERERERAVMPLTAEDLER